MNIPHVIKLKDGREVAVSIPSNIRDQDTQAKWSGYRPDQVQRVTRVS